MAARRRIRDRSRCQPRTSDLLRRLLGTLRACVIAIPPGAPRANAFAERWVRTIRHELLDRTLIWNQRQLRRLLEEFVAHHNEHRPHRGLGQRAPTDQGDATVIELDQQIRRTTACHGLINEYRVAA